MATITAKRHLPARALIGLLVAGGLIAGVACSSSSSSSSSSISIVLTNWPSIVTVSQSVSLTANVLNDTSNEGIDWSTSNGTISPSHTANGVTAVFTAPASTGTVKVTATSTADSSASQSVTITIVSGASNSQLSGAYVFQVQGNDSYGNYTAVGTVITDGSGNITGGEQDYADNVRQAGGDQVTGTYAIGPDGRGSITLNVNDAALPNNGVETFSLALTSATHASIIQFDATATSSGTLDSQPSGVAVAASINGYYAFISGGIDISSGTPMACGGTAMLNAATDTMSNGTFYENDGGSTSSALLTGTITAPDAFGRGTISTNVGFHFAYYIVQGEVLRIIEEDVPTYIGAGMMAGQAASGVTPAFSNATLTGNYVFSAGGSSEMGPEGAVGQFTANGNGGLTAGFADVNNDGNVTNGSIWAQSSYAIAPNGAGTFSLPSVGVTQDMVSLMIFATDPAVNLIDPSNPNGGGGALILDFDGSSVATGQIVPQTTGTVTGNYALNMQLVNSSGETDFVGQTVAGGAGTLTGAVDVNSIGTVSANQALTGAYTADTSNAGRFTGTLTVAGTVYHVTYYEVSSGVLLILDTDSAVIGIGAMETE